MALFNRSGFGGGLGFNDSLYGDSYYGGNGGYGGGPNNSGLFGDYIGINGGGTSGGTGNTGGSTGITITNVGSGNTSVGDITAGDNNTDNTPIIGEMHMILVVEKFILHLQMKM